MVACRGYSPEVGGSIPPRATNGGATVKSTAIFMKVLRSWPESHKTFAVKQINYKRHNPERGGRRRRWECSIKLGERVDSVRRN